MTDKEYFSARHEMLGYLIKEIRKNSVIYYPGDLNCEWLAMDKDGYLGIFLNLMDGPIPISALSKDVLPVTQVRDFLLAHLPVVSDVRYEYQGFGVLPDPYDWEIACRGIFIYEWSYVDQKYKLVTSPVNPITNKSLEGELLKLAEAVVINFSLFTSKEKFSPRALFECIDTF